MKLYRVETLLPSGRWHFLQGSQGNKSFVEGVVFGLYKAVQAQRPRTRIVCCSDGKVIEDLPARDGRPRPAGLYRGR